MLSHPQSYIVRKRERDSSLGRGSRSHQDNHDERSTLLFLEYFQRNLRDLRALNSELTAPANFSPHSIAERTVAHRMTVNKTAVAASVISPCLQPAKRCRLRVYDNSPSIAKNTRGYMCIPHKARCVHRDTDAEICRLVHTILSLALCVCLSGAKRTEGITNN